MRAVMIGILALCCGGCAAAPAVVLVSRDPESPWLVGQHWVRTESSRATVSTSFDRAWLDHLIFEVEVVNQTDSALVVDPSKFTYRLSSSGNDLPAKLKGSFPAVPPSAVAARLDKEISRRADENFLVAGLTVLAVIAVLAFDLMEPVDVPAAELTTRGSSGSSRVALYDGDPGEQRLPDRKRAREMCLQALLPRTTLAPGASVRGELWLPAGPVYKAVGAAPAENELSITAAPARPPADHGITLRTPDVLGGQEIEYSVSAEY